MSRRTRRLSLVLAALAAGVGAALVVPAVGPVGAAAPDSASFTAVDFQWTAGGDTAVTIAAGGTVTFAYPSGASAHNADFSGADPSSCTQIAGPSSGSVPPLPATPTAAGWSGSCRFDAPGRYAFQCDLHPTRMMGTITVVDETGTTTTTTTGTTTTPTGTTTVPPARTGPVDPGTGGGGYGGGGGAGGTGPALGSLPRLAASRVSVARRQRGAILRGAVTAPAEGTRIVVAAFASNRALSERPPRRARAVRVGSQRRRATGDGARSPFAVRLSEAARDALRRRGSLAVTLRIVVTPPTGSARATSVTVVVRPPRGG